MKNANWLPVKNHLNWFGCESFFTTAATSHLFKVLKRWIFQAQELCPDVVTYSASVSHKGPTVVVMMWSVLLSWSTCSNSKNILGKWQANILEWCHLAFNGCAKSIRNLQSCNGEDFDTVVPYDDLSRCFALLCHVNILLKISVPWRPHKWSYVVLAGPFLRCSRLVSHSHTFVWRLGSQS